MRTTFHLLKHPDIWIGGLRSAKDFCHCREAYVFDALETSRQDILRHQSSLSFSTDLDLSLLAKTIIAFSPRVVIA